MSTTVGKDLLRSLLDTANIRAWKIHERWKAPVFGDRDEGGAGGAGGRAWRGRDGLDRGTLPRGSRRELDGTAGEQRPAGLVRIAGRQGHLDPGFHLGHPG